MDIASEYKNPSKLLIAFIDSMKEALCLIDENGNTILNENARNLQKKGFDINAHTKQVNINSTKSVEHQGVIYDIEKKDINHGTNSCLCTIVPKDDTIHRLTESSKKLKKVLSAF